MIVELVQSEICRADHRLEIEERVDVTVSVLNSTGQQPENACKASMLES